MSKRYVSMGNGQYESMTSAEVAANLRKQGFAPTMANQVADAHEKIAMGKPKAMTKPQKQPKIPTSMEWELPDSGARM